MYGYKKLYIDGELRDADSGETRDVFCPADDSRIGSIAWAGKQDTLAALLSAERAYRSWSTAPAEKRVGYMLRLRELVIENQELLREAEMYEHGKTWEQTEEGYLGVVNALEYYANEARRLHGHALTDTTDGFEHRVVYKAAGVAGAFVAWNFPLLNLAFKLGPAMAAGCPLIIRPSTDTPVSAYITGELCAQAELPPGVVNILAGSVSDTADVITKSTIPSVLTLIGSTRTGLEIMRNGSTSVKHYSMELGGNAPAIIFKDADPELAADTVSMLKFANAGQICVTPNRVYVHEDLHDEFVSRVVKNASAVKIGHGRNSGADMGPIINKKARGRIDSRVKEAVTAGAKLEYGGEIPAGLSGHGSYYMPTVLSNVSDNLRLSCDEIFGPVVSIMKFSEYDEVMKRANNTTMGLASYIFTNDITTMQHAARDLEFGEVQVNGVRYNVDLPHIGIKQSGTGLDGSQFALDDYLVKRRITTSLQPRK